ncbi:hypothetical protein BT96DRAFT_1004435 [Gymnopus androsaceus JB14]|uniref:Uncharacterized protein n=1 Tax=Gymnopus androsaceus JB14 TaxID=1447944 RepID=A0A6A4GR12_9AGAR|nr:hypothetical protein BT96DRAFT_1004435 [Gymnopus androsaceus JB14]
MLFSPSFPAPPFTCELVPPALSDLSVIEPATLMSGDADGFCTLRNGKEFSPSTSAPDLILCHFNTASLLSKGLSRASFFCPAFSLIRKWSYPLPSSALFQSALFAPPPHPAKHPRTSTTAVTGAACQKLLYHKWCRVTCRAQQDTLGTTLKAVVLKRAAEADIIYVQLPANTSQSTWSGRRMTPSSARVLSSCEVLEISGLRLVEWDGSASTVIHTEYSHRPMVLLARPRGVGWLTNASLETLYCQACLPPSHKPNCHGEYMTLPAGCSFGGGRTCPGNYTNTVHNVPLVQAMPDNLLYNV